VKFIHTKDWKNTHFTTDQIKKETESLCGKNEVVPSKGQHIFVGTRVELGII